MTYSTPELLHIDAAQNLVLDTSSDATCIRDSPFDATSHMPELW